MLLLLPYNLGDPDWEEIFRYYFLQFGALDLAHWTRALLNRGLSTLLCDNSNFDQHMEVFRIKKSHFGRLIGIVVCTLLSHFTLKSTCAKSLQLQVSLIWLTTRQSLLNRPQICSPPPRRPSRTPCPGTWCSVVPLPEAQSAVVWHPGRWGQRRGARSRTWRRRTRLELFVRKIVESIWEGWWTRSISLGRKLVTSQWRWLSPRPGLETKV